MIARLPARCFVCDGVFVIRIGVSVGRMQRLIFECVHCQSVIRARLHAFEDRDAYWHSEDIETLEDQVDEAVTPSITVYTDVPVARELQGVPASQALVSPFIQMTMAAPGMAEDTMSRIGTIREARELLVPALRRISVHAGNGRWEALCQALIDVGMAHPPDRPPLLHPLAALGRYVDMAALGFQEQNVAFAASGELMETLAFLEINKPAELRTTLDTFLSDAAWAQHRRRVVDTTFAVLDSVDAIIPALAWEAMIEGEADPDDYRVMRDDFDVLKGLYQDVFEVGSRTLV